MQHARHQLQAVLDPVVDLLEQDLALLDRGAQAGLDPLALDRHAQQVGRTLQEGDVVLGRTRPRTGCRPRARRTACRRPAGSRSSPAGCRSRASSSGVRNRSSCSRWFEITGLPVRSAKPAGEARSAPTLATPTTSGPQPTPARTSRQSSDGRCSSTLQNSASSPSAASRAVWSSSSVNGVPLSASTPSSVRISCWRMRWPSAVLGQLHGWLPLGLAARSPVPAYRLASAHGASLSSLRPFGPASIVATDRRSRR